MLKELQIRNFAVVESQTISFGPGLNVLSGETGAGKSVVLQALELILGARPKTSYERPGTNGWEIQALFDLSKLAPAVIEELPDIARGEELLLGRAMIEGKGKVYVNGRISSVALLEEIAAQLINICGQNQQLKLLDPKHHRALLDDYGSLGTLLEEYRLKYSEYRTLEQTIERSRASQSEREKRKDELELLIGSLEEISIHAGLREELESLIDAAASREGILRTSSAAQDLLDADEGVYSQLSKLDGLYKELLALGCPVKGLSEKIRDAIEIVSDTEHAMQRALSSVELDPEALEEARDRLSKLATLERRYRRDSAGLAELYEKSRQELSQLLEPEKLEELERDLKAKRQELTLLAGKLSEGRRKAAKKILKDTTAELAELNMSDAKIEVELTPGELSAEGAEKVQFLFSPHKGGVLRPLAQIASGGELSRITLVLKKLLRDKTGVNVLVFDEVDTGVSGGVARAMGMKLRELSVNSQVLCITHLPQVASLADRHFLVVKEEGKSSIRELSKLQRVEEIARMLAGYKVTDAARESARELMASNT